MKSYGQLQLTESSPGQTFVEKLTLADLMEWLKISESITTTEQFEHLQSLIIAARSIAEIYQGVDLVPKQYDLYLDYFCEPNIELRYPLQSVELVRYTETDGNIVSLTEDTDYLVDLARALIMPAFNTTWPAATLAPSSAVLIRFTSGYSSTHPFWSNRGQFVLQGMRLLITGWHEGRFPFDADKVTEYPYAITDLLSFGARPRVY